MALIRCGECKKEVSTLAAACPHCGAPIPKAVGNKSKTSTPATRNEPRHGRLGLEKLAGIARSVGNWLLGTLVAVFGGLLFFKGSMSSIPVAIAALLVLPPVRRLAHSTIGVSVAPKVRWPLVIALFIGAWTIGLMEIFSLSEQQKKESVEARAAKREAKIEQAAAKRKAAIEYFLNNKHSILAELEQSYELGEYEETITQAEIYLGCVEFKLLPILGVVQPDFE